MRGFCPDSEWFAAFAERRLSESDEVWLKRHASRCDECRRAMALVNQQVGREAPDTVPADVNARLRGAVLCAIERRHSAGRLRPWNSGDMTRYVIFAAAVLVVVLGLTLVLLPQADEDGSGPPKIVDHEKPKPIDPKNEQVKRVEGIAPREWPPVLPKEYREKEKVVEVPWREEDDFINRIRRAIEKH